jgi:hypothetical protein
MPQGVESRVQIAAILLVRNEDLFLDRILRNIHDFCDRIIIADHGSRDRTPQIALTWAAEKSAVLRAAIQEGKYDRYRQIYGHALHCDEMDLDRMTACGYLTPPCRTVTKLFNFNAISDWEGPCPERLHGGRIVFREGYDASMNSNLHQELSWEESPFRCLHTVFLRRSSLDADGGADG